MPVENAEYISDLNRDFPTGSDQISKGDDHIRNIKAAVQDTFPEIKGKVTVGHEKLNEVDVALPAAPTADGSVLHNSGGAWSESEVLKIVGGEAFIPGLSGLGDIALYVDNAGQIKAASMADNPTLLHAIKDHTDVDYPAREPREDDVLMFNGSEWVNTPMRNGSMLKVCQQPSTAGDFQGTSWGWRCPASGNNTGKVFSFDVPDGYRFCLINISTSNSTGVESIMSSVAVDGVEQLKGFNIADWPEWNNGSDINYGGAVTFEVVDKIEVKVSNASATAGITVQGYFFEV